MWEGILMGAGLAAFNGIGAWMVARWTLRQGNQAFIAGVLGGTFVRLLLMGIGAVIVLKNTAASPTWFLGSLVISFVLFQTLEVWLLLRMLKRNRAQATGS